MSPVRKGRGSSAASMVLRLAEGRCVHKQRKEAVVYKARTIMPRVGATGDAGGAEGGKVRSTEAQKITRE
jgi:hypothetical protein